MKGRLMFFVVKNKVIFEDKPSGLTHAEWLALLTTQRSIEWLESHTRGYYFNNKIIFYTGKDYAVTKQVIIDAHESITQLKHCWNLADNCTVQFGEHKGKFDAGTVEQFIANYRKL